MIQVTSPNPRRQGTSPTSQWNLVGALDPTSQPARFPNASNESWKNLLTCPQQAVAPPQKKNQLKWHEMATCCRKEPLQVTDLCNYESIAHRFTNYPGVVPSKWLLQVSEWIYSYLRFIPLIPCEGPARNLPFTLGSWFGRSFFCQDWRVQWWSWIQLSCKNSRSYTPAHPFFKQNMTNYGIYYHCAIVYSYSICNI